MRCGLAPIPSRRSTERKNDGVESGQRPSVGRRGLAQGQYQRAGVGCPNPLQRKAVEQVVV